MKLKPEDKAALKALQVIPNVGPAIAADLLLLGYRAPKDLKRAKPRVMYDRLSELEGPQDMCVLDVFEAAVDYAKTGDCDVWWEYSRRRKRG